MTAPMLLRPKGKAANGVEIACACRSCRDNTGRDTRAARRRAKRRERHAWRHGRR